MTPDQCVWLMYTVVAVAGLVMLVLPAARTGGRDR